MTTIEVILLCAIVLGGLAHVIKVEIMRDRIQDLEAQLDSLRTYMERAAERRGWKQKEL